MPDAARQDFQFSPSGNRMGDQPVRLSRDMLVEIVSHALEEAPYECCGVIAGREGKATELYRAKNGVPGELRKFRYEVETNDLFRINRAIDDQEWEWLVVYHSHTGPDEKGEAYPSETDIRLARLRPEPYYLLVSVKYAPPMVRAFRILDGVVTEEDIEIAEPASIG